MEIKQEPIKIYARVDTNNYVTQFLETAHNKGEILETDIFIEGGYGDYFAYPHAREDIPLVALDYQGCHNFKTVDEILTETTAVERVAELVARPKPRPSENDLLRAMIKAQTERNDFMEDCMAELAMVAYS